MTKDFINRLMHDRIIDTRNYRYIVTEEHDNEEQWAEIKRIPLSQLDTTATIDGWETVKRIY